MYLCPLFERNGYFRGKRRLFLKRRSRVRVCLNETESLQQHPLQWLLSCGVALQVSLYSQNCISLLPCRTLPLSQNEQDEILPAMVRNLATAATLNSCRGMNLPQVQNNASQSEFVPVEVINSQ